jgi:hypothetical protein
VVRDISVGSGADWQAASMPLAISIAAIARQNV